MSPKVVNFLHLYQSSEHSKRPSKYKPVVERREKFSSLPPTWLEAAKGKGIHWRENHIMWRNLGPSPLRKQLGFNKIIPINQMFRWRRGERKGDECGLENGPIKSQHLGSDLGAGHARRARWFGTSHSGLTSPNMAFGGNEIIYMYLAYPCNIVY